MKGIQGKTCLITGSAKGIGLATAHSFLEFGANVSLLDIDQESGLSAFLEANTKFPGKVLFSKCDTSLEDEIISACSNTIKQFGRIDCLVNGAAIFIMKGVEATVEDWNKSNSINITAYSLCAKYSIPSMISNGGGSIINIASISGLIAQESFLTYNTAKGAIINMTRCMALDLAKHNIRVNAVSPGSTWTKSSEEFHKTELKLTREQAEADPTRGGKHVLKRYADPEEIAYPIVFLASDYASFITGENLMIDGGYTII